MSHQDYSFKAATTLSAYRIVYVSAENTVALCNTSAAVCVGVTVDENKDTTTAVPVRVAGLAKVYFNDTVSAGALVGFDASGRGVPFTDTGTNWAIGKAVETVSATGSVCEVIVQPMRVSTGGV